MEAGSSVAQHTPFKLQRGLAYTHEVCSLVGPTIRGHVGHLSHFPQTGQWACPIGWWSGKRSWTLGGTSNLAK